MIRVALILLTLAVSALASPTQAATLADLQATLLAKGDALKSAKAEFQVAYDEAGRATARIKAARADENSFLIPDGNAFVVLDAAAVTRLVLVSRDIADPYPRTSEAVIADHPEEVRLLAMLGLSSTTADNPLLSIGGETALRDKLRWLEGNEGFGIEEKHNRDAASRLRKLSDDIRNLQIEILILIRQISAMTGWQLPPEAAAPLPCPGLVAGLMSEGTAVAECYCDARQLEFPGSVWGNRSYQSLSDICTAALHADAVTRAGGYVKVGLRPEGCFRYEALSARGIDSREFEGPNGLRPAFYFPAVSDGSCADAPVEACARSAQAYLDKQQTEVACLCRTADEDPPGPVYGKYIYAVQSHICTAARHAGAVTLASGATVRITLRPEGCQRFEGSTDNGVVSQPFGAGAAFVFSMANVPQTDCPAPPEPTGSDCPLGVMSYGTDTVGQRLTCTCTAERVTETLNVPLIGSGPYDSNSDICLSARHAGAIPATGGEVTLEIRPICKRYVGSERNGLVSKETAFLAGGVWNSYVHGNVSYDFPAFAGGPCPPMPPP